MDDLQRDESPFVRQGLAYALPVIPAPEELESLATNDPAPAVRAADPSTIICAAGTSCRDQITHTTERETRHPIEIFAEALVN